jgi:hypothetical protein
MHFRMLIYGFADLCEGGDVEDFGCKEVLNSLKTVPEMSLYSTYGDYECVGRR